MALPGPPPYRLPGPAGGEPAHDTPDPLGLARLPELATLVAARWPEAREWHRARQRAEFDPRTTGSLLATTTVGEFEERVGRRARPFRAEFLLLPVRDTTVRHVGDNRYLVPERVYAGPQWPGWLADLVTRIG